MIQFCNMLFIIFLILYNSIRVYLRTKERYWADGLKMWPFSNLYKCIALHFCTEYMYGYFMYEVLSEMLYYIFYISLIEKIVFYLFLTLKKYISLHIFVYQKANYCYRNTVRTTVYCRLILKCHQHHKPYRKVDFRKKSTPSCYRIKIQSAPSRYRIKNNQRPLATELRIISALSLPN